MRESLADDGYIAACRCGGRGGATSLLARWSGTTRPPVNEAAGRQFRMQLNLLAAVYAPMWRNEFRGGCTTTSDGTAVVFFLDPRRVIFAAIHPQGWSAPVLTRSPHAAPSANGAGRRRPGRAHALVNAVDVDDAGVTAA